MAHTLKTAADYLRATLTSTQAERPDRPGMVDGPDGPECEWAAYERACMHQAVNKIRTDEQLTVVALDDILRVERLAAGHSDYSRKFALYCAELAMKEG